MMTSGYQNENKRDSRSSSNNNSCVVHLIPLVLNATPCRHRRLHLMRPFPRFLRTPQVTPLPAPTSQLDATGTPSFQLQSFCITESSESPQLCRYDRSISYWQRVPATNDGVLGGFINVASSVGQSPAAQPHVAHAHACAGHC